MILKKVGGLLETERRKIDNNGSKQYIVHNSKGNIYSLSLKQESNRKEDRMKKEMTWE